MSELEEFLKADIIIGVQQNSQLDEYELIPSNIVRVISFVY